MINNDDNHLVVQSNPLIEGQYKLDLIPAKLIRVLVSMIKPDDSTLKKKFYKLSANDFAAITESDSNDIYHQVKEAAHKLKTTVITIRKNKSTIVTNWLASYEYQDHEGWIEFEFSAKLKTELLKIKDQFTQYYLANISRLRSQYSIRLYELLKQYLVIGNRKMTIEELKPLLGIEKGEYKEFWHIRQRVLIPAHREINAKTDIGFQWKPFKHVRKITGVEFYDIHSKAQAPNWILGLLPPQYRQHKDILNNLRRWLDVKGDEYVREKIQYTTNQNPAKFADHLFVALEKDHGQGFTPAQQNLFFEGDKLGFKIKDGMQIEIDGVIYTVEDGHVRTEAGVLPRGTITKGIASGKYKVIDIDLGTPPEASEAKAKRTRKPRKSA